MAANDLRDKIERQSAKLRKAVREANEQAKRAELQRKQAAAKDYTIELCAGDYLDNFVTVMDKYDKNVSTVICALHLHDRRTRATASIEARNNQILISGWAWEGLSEKRKSQVMPKVLAGAMTVASSEGHLGSAQAA